MKFFTKLLVLGLAAEVTVASSWFSKAGMLTLSIHSACHHHHFGIFRAVWSSRKFQVVDLGTRLACTHHFPHLSHPLFIYPLCWYIIFPVYNKWHETELERWLSDNNVPYPSPADRKDLENLVKENWQSKVASPYSDWDTKQLNSYLKQKGVETKETAEANKDGLISQVKTYWYEAEDKAEDAWSNVRDWVFDSWTGKLANGQTCFRAFAKYPHRFSTYGICWLPSHSRSTPKKEGFSSSKGSLQLWLYCKEGRRDCCLPWELALWNLVWVRYVIKMAIRMYLHIS